MLAVLYLVCGLPFLLCGTAEEQEWAKDESEHSPLTVTEADTTPGAVPPDGGSQGDRDQ